jgi:hypothetical protein
LSHCETRSVCAIKFPIKVHYVELRNLSKNHKIPNKMSFFLNCPFIDGLPVIPNEMLCILTNLMICKNNLFLSERKYLVLTIKSRKFKFCKSRGSNWSNRLKDCIWINWLFKKRIKLWRYHQIFKLYFLFNFIEKWASNRPKADKRGFYVNYLILLKNEPQIGSRPIKRDIIFKFC